MKPSIPRPSLAVFASVVLLAAIAGAMAPGTPSRAIDDPPPEPVDCPMCGGNPELHARRMLMLEAIQGRLLAYALRW
jgi:hypothetical protein